jgi:osmoprotectant transport system ATP-binding protein
VNGSEPNPPSADHPMIRLDGVGKRYPDGTVAVHELDLDVAEGQVAVMVGPSGCGKTTTMRMINRLIEPTSGRIFLEGDDVTAVDPVQLRRRIGYVIQQVGLFPHQDVATNVATVPRLLGWDRQRIASRTGELLELVGLEPDRFAKRYPSELSGGQRQRVGVARALAADPPVLLMDEPFGAVDPIARERLQDEFLRLQRTVRKTIVFVTHDVDEAIRMGDRIAVMRDGGLEQYADPATVLTRPANEFVADFVGAKRSLRRLRVSEVGPGLLQKWPVVAAGAPLADVGAPNGTGGTVVADGSSVRGLIRGPVTRRSAQRSDGTAGSIAEPVARVEIGAPLESALAQMLGGPANGGSSAVVVVTDGESVAGVLTLDALLSGAREPIAAQEG